MSLTKIDAIQVRSTDAEVYARIITALISRFPAILTVNPLQAPTRKLGLPYYSHLQMRTPKLIHRKLLLPQPSRSSVMVFGDR